MGLSAGEAAVRLDCRSSQHSQRFGSLFGEPVP